ncbi:MAG: cystathionine gamma-synthase [Thermoflexales bacterium]|nr:cystathionine gamma-synthase [Thermoflexales bacterium]MDW8352796.1 cystathionine gamma-synthase [Anaerolineae bacterium]
MNFETLAIHAGQPPDPAYGAVMTPIYQTSTYVQKKMGEAAYDYARTANPTRTALQDCIAALEGGRHGLAFASGMAAIDCLLRLLKPGDHVLASNDVYGGTYRIFTRVYEDYGVQASFVEMGDLDAVRAALRPNTRMIWIETPTNPLLKVADIAAIARLRDGVDRSIWIVVDNTFASPYLQRPLALGADIVVHSATKYLGGHSDVVNGLVVLNDDATFARLKFLQNAVGAVPGPLDCFLVLRGIKTLHVRMERHSANAMRIAAWLEAHPRVARVMYPGLPSHPQHAIARRQMRAFGGMISFIVKGGAEEARRVAEATQLFALAESLGGVESLIEVPAAMTHTSVANSPLEVNPALIRLSVGIEHVDDLIGDLAQALQAGGTTDNG